jgi:hypothetical protein
MKFLTVLFVIVLVATVVGCEQKEEPTVTEIEAPAVESDAAAAVEDAVDEAKVVLKKTIEIGE